MPARIARRGPLVELLPRGSCAIATAGQRETDVIIDCHGHYTTAPAAHTAWREQQVAAWEAGTTPPAYPSISDDEIRETIEAQPAAADGRAGHRRHAVLAACLGDGAARRRRRGEPGVVAPVQRPRPPGRRPSTRGASSPVAASCRSPPGADLEASVAELRRCVEELGFVGCNLNPDPSGGFWTSPPLTDRSWYPLYEAAIELDVPAMVHVSGVGHPGVPRDRGVLHQRRHHGLHAARAGQPLRRPARPAPGHPARRGSGALPLGPLPRTGRHAEAAAGRVERHAATSSSTPASTTSPGSTCCWTSSTPRTSCSARRWWARSAGSTSGRATTTTTPAGTSRPRSRRDAGRRRPRGRVRAQRPARLSAARPGARGVTRLRSSREPAGGRSRRRTPPVSMTSIPIDGANCSRNSRAPSFARSRSARSS